MFGLLRSEVPIVGMQPYEASVFDNQLRERPVLRTLRRGCFVELLRTEEDQVFFLRKVAQDICQELQLENRHVFIRYKHKYPGLSKVVHEFATALPWNRRSVKRNFGGSEHDYQFHRRWLYAGGGDLHKGDLWMRDIARD